MSDLTVYAEALIATVARAFYDDEAVCLIDVLIRDKFLRDDDMAPRLSLPARKLRSTLQFLQEEHLVKYETVDDLEQGGSQQTKFWYIDYNHAVHTIRLRLHLLRQSLEKAEMRARSSSFYLCPGYKIKRCNGRYTEEEAQQIVNHDTGLFLCQECFLNYQNDPNAPTKDKYTLQLVDNTKDLRRAMDNMRRVTVQLSTKMIGNEQIRAGIYDLLQKLRSNKGGSGGGLLAGGSGGAGGISSINIKTSKPITSNLPSENFALGIGSKRLAGTGRTAGIKARKLEQQGVADSATAARNYLVGAGGPKGSGNRSAEGSDLTFLKNAMGNEIAFSVEKGGGARANLLATKTRRHRKLMEAAASRVGASIPLDVRFKISKRKRSSDENNNDSKDGESKDDDDSDDSNGGKDKKNGNGKKGNNKKQKTVKTTQGQPSNIPLSFLDNNIGREGLDKEMELLRQRDIRDAGGNNNGDDDDDGGDGDDGDALNDHLIHNQPTFVELDDIEDNMPHLWEEDKRKTAFQAMYSKEMNRQIGILNIDTTTENAGVNNVLSPKSSFVSAAANATASSSASAPAPPPQTVSLADPEEYTVLWEDAE